MARILVVDDESRMASLIQRELEDRGHGAATAGDGPAALEEIERGNFDLVVTDLRMPGMDGLELLSAIKAKEPQIEVILMTAYASAQTAVRAMKDGAFDYLIKPFEMDELAIMVDRISERRQLRLENAELRREITGGPVEIVGASGAMRHVLELVEKVAPQDTTVLIHGDSGTGKELIARAIHTMSQRADHSMVAVNCAAIPETLIESELFGHERGSFTGADQRRLGRFELATGGTLFLDEVTELAPQAQAKLLRALQERVIERVGGAESIRVDVRVVAASNRNLEEAVAAGALREDLYYRLKVFPIHIPPLRERREDVHLLAEHFAARFGSGNRLTEEAHDVLQRYAWPGNVRELANVLERSVILAGVGNPITVEHLADLGGLSGIAPDRVPGSPAPSAISPDAISPEVVSPEVVSPEVASPKVAVRIPAGGVDLEELEKQHILEAIRRAEGNKSEAARLLHITRRRLYSRMKHHDIEY
ncbi:sigma-54-dependent transcriptional regulator [Gemmatimonadota bacterium]